MTRQEAIEYVREHEDDDHLDEADIVETFIALFARSPDDGDHEEGLWSLCCEVVTT